MRLFVDLNRNARTSAPAPVALESTAATSNPADRKRALIPMLFALLVAVAMAVYGYRLGRDALTPSEAYSALAAAQPSIDAIARSALRFDPGKPVLYQVLLHWFCGWFGHSEVALRAFSLVFGMASLVLVFAYGCELFGAEVGLVAASLWAFNPVAVVFARWARMYSMFVALALGHLFAMTKLQRRRSTGLTILAGLLGAAMLYSHLGGALIIGADLVVAAREFRRDRRSSTWPAIAIAIILFIPFVPTAIVQVRGFFFGHWLDWIGVKHAPLAERIIAAGFAASFVLWLVMGNSAGSEDSESFRRCLAYAAIPLVALEAGSFVVRPMFSIRYAGPSVAVAAVALAYMIDQAGARARNLVAAAVAWFFLILTPLSYAALWQPWREIASQISASGSVQQPIFFEGGFFSPQRLIDKAQSKGFPQGFFRVPFDYYFHEPNPREAIPGADPAKARRLIEAQAQRTGGAWLVSGKHWPQAITELPSGPDFRTDVGETFSRVLLLHVRFIPRSRTSRRSPLLSGRR